VESDRRFRALSFGLANAGVELSSVGTATWLIWLRCCGRKTASIFSLGILRTNWDSRCLQDANKDLVVVGIIAGFGFTVALFVAGEAFVDPAHRCR
jgi:NhaA family Na+:H+ antiporter